MSTDPQPARSTSTARSAASLFAWVLLCFSASAIGGLAMTVSGGGGGGGWYASLNKPVWTPPGWVFAPVWTLLYLLMGVAAWLVWLRPKAGTRTAALTLFVIQLVLNAAWTPLFFGAQRIGWALVDLSLLWLALVATVVLFWRVRPVAGALLLPYVLWVSYAATLNVGLWRMNP